MKILLTNDDGIESRITLGLFEFLKKDHEVCLIAPSKDKSGQGAAITLRDSVEINKIEENMYSVDGTPSDCVFMGLMAIMTELPDIVVSGVNRGANMGDDVIHSGTLGAAFTARKLSYPPLALSIAGKSFENFESSFLVTKLMLDYIQKNYEKGENTGLVLNVNIPNLKFTELSGINLSRLGNRGVPLAPEFKGNGDKVSYKIGKSGPPDGTLSGTDFEAIKNNCVSVTPLYWDMTAIDRIKGNLPSVK